MTTGLEHLGVIDIEPGCCVFSKTMQSGAGYVGGVVFGEGSDAGGGKWFSVMRWDRAEPTEARLYVDDIDPATIRWFARDARDAASKLFAWLAKTPNSNPDRAVWSRRALTLQMASESGLYLPGAERAYQAALRAKLTVSQLPVPETAGERITAAELEADAS